MDRGKAGSKIHVLTDRRGLPLAVALSGTNEHDSQALVSLVRGLPAICQAPGSVEGVITRSWSRRVRC